AAADKMRSLLPDVHKPAVARIAAVSDENVPRLHLPPVRSGQESFPFSRADQLAIQTQAVEQVIKHRDSPFRIAILQSMLIGALHLAKLLEQLIAAWQAHQRTIDAQQAMASPTRNCLRVLGPIEIG